MNAVAVGPFLFSMGVLALLAGLVASQSTAGFLARRGYEHVGNLAYLLLILALVAARVGFVVRWWSGFAGNPWGILNVRDGGFDPLTGLVTLALAVVLVALWRQRWRRPLLATALAGVAAWGLVVLGASRMQAAAHPPLPAVALHGLEGGTVQATSWKGQPLVINFWATWCRPCQREMPVLAQAQRELPGVRFVFADQAEDAAHVRGFLNARHLRLSNVVIDDGGLASHYNVRGFPTTLFIDAGGRLRDIHVGELSRATLRASLQRIAPGGPLLRR